MNRREFLKIVAAGAALVGFRPAWGQKADSAVELAGWFDSQFKAAFGAPWAFVEPRPAEYEESVDRPETWETPRDYSKFTPYHTYAVVAPDERAGVAEIQRMFSALLVSFPAVKGSPLWWRMPERIEVKPWTLRQEGRVIFTREQLADGETPPEGAAGETYWDEESDVLREGQPVIHHCTRIRMRVAIPVLQRLGGQCDRSYAEGGWSTHLRLPLLKAEGQPAKVVGV